MRKIIIRNKLPGYAYLEVELENWLREKINTEKVWVSRGTEDTFTLSFEIDWRPEHQRIDPGDFEKLLRNLPKGKSLEQALHEAIVELQQEQKAKSKIPDDGLPF